MLFPLFFPKKRKNLRHLNSCYSLFSVNLHEIPNQTQKDRMARLQCGAILIHPFLLDSKLMLLELNLRFNQIQIA